MNLAENIRTFRKARGLTQEQLAEALGVTHGAIYKWETGRSTPEVPLLMELADLFETSVDVLLGYQFRSRDRAHLVERLRICAHDRNAEDALADAEKALQRYPNDFAVVYLCADLYRFRGIDRQDKKLLRRALDLFRHACVLIDQNRDPPVSLLSMQEKMAVTHAALGENRQAVELLQQNNPCRVHSALIGNLLASECGKPEAARPYLSEALLDSILKQLWITTGYLHVFLSSGDHGSALDVLEWTFSMLAHLKYPGRISALDKYRAYFLAVRARIDLCMQQPDRAREALMEARAAAEAFDAAPSYAVDGIRFVERGERYLCGENGNGLSGGEKQRISIARSLLRNASVLLVDEATSALDARTAWQVSDAILNLEHMTRIVVTHTLEEGLLRRYDQILALKDGRIAEMGNFEELMKKKGYFYSLYTVSQT